MKGHIIVRSAGHIQRNFDTVQQSQYPAESGGKRHSLAKLSYTSSEAAEAMGISVRSLRRLEMRGLIRCSRALGKKLYPLTEIQRFLEETL